MTKRKKSTNKCARCEKTLMMELQEDGKYKTRSVHSQHTGNHYCWPTEGCNK